MGNTDLVLGFNLYCLIEESVDLTDQISGEVERGEIDNFGEGE